jgi:NAD-dependent dihydropyrimidine dehydrogenase PreA subunit
MCGGDPECIKVCSAKAIKFVTREEGMKIIRSITK